MSTEHSKISNILQKWELFKTFTHQCHPLESNVTVGMAQNHDIHLHVHVKLYNNLKGKT